MVVVTIQTLLIAQIPHPSVLVLCPLKDKGSTTSYRVLPIWIGAAEAICINIALNNIPHPRPLTHDLLTETISTLHAEVVRVEITRVEGKTFFAQVILKQNDQELTIDARPSDAISLALRNGADMYVAEEVLNEASYPYIINGTVQEEKDIQEFHEFINTIQPEDFLM